MSYTKPSVEVYQDLVNAGGVANTTPDLETCIIGPAYNVLTYTAGSVASQVLTAVTSPISTTGAISAKSYDLVVASTASLNVGDTLLVSGAGTNGATLQGLITSISGNVVTLDTAASTSVTAVSVYSSGVISNSAVSNTFNLPGQVPGQVIDASTIKVYASSSLVKTYTSVVSGPSGYNYVNVSTGPDLLGSITSGATSLTVTQGNAYNLVAGDTISIAGAGTAGAALTVTVVSIAGNNVSVTPAAVTTVTGAVLTKNPVSNVNPTTNTLKAEIGDRIVATYTNSSSVASTFTTTVQSVTTTSGDNGDVTKFTFNDLLPSDASIHIVTSGTNSSGASTISVVSTTGLNVSDQVLIPGGAAGGYDLLAKVTAKTSNSFTIDTVGGLGTAVTSGTTLLRVGYFTVSVEKAYNDLLIDTSSVDTSNAGTLGQVTVEANPKVEYGTLVSGNIFAGYKALRTDLANSVLTFNNVSDLKQQLVDISDNNPLGLACEMALANTVTRVRAIAVASNDISGYEAALTLAEGERVYSLVPLTQDKAIIQMFEAHVKQMSTPQMGSWRVAIVNTAIPTVLYIGQYSPTYVNSNANNTISKVNNNFVLNSSGATFVADGVVPSDVVVVTAPSNAAGSYTVQQVTSTQLVISGVSNSLSLPATNLSYYVVRNLSRTDSAEQIQAQSGVYISNRVWYIQPDLVGISVNGITKYLPGYYLCAAHAGMVAGFPVQQGFTNIGVAGVSDLKHSNYFFGRTDLDNMAGAGVCLYVQDSQGGTPYCRHALTTDMSVLEYREQMAVKVWDYLSYYFRDLCKSFIGVWNITPETLNVLRQVLTAGAEQVKGQKLPKLGAPLQDMKISSLAQNAYNLDNVDAYLSIKIPYSLNYLNIHLVI